MNTLLQGLLHFDIDYGNDENDLPLIRIPLVTWGTQMLTIRLLLNLW